MIKPSNLCNPCNLWITLLILALAVASEPVAPAPVFVSDNPNSIYAADPNDSWNRIFHALFTRTVKHRVSNDFPEGAPFVPFNLSGMGRLSLRISKEEFSRRELGDRAIEPLYPAFLSNGGPAQILAEPRYSEFTAALREAIDETKQRSPIERAMMQADVWAAYDLIYRMRRSSPEIRVDRSDREGKLLTLLRQFIRKLALSSEEIKSLKSNYLVAAERSNLPDLFSTESGWLEIELLPNRHHDQTANYRRAARVFVKPRTRPSDPAQFVESLKGQQHHNKIEAVALIVQNLLIDTTGRVVPSPLFSDVQFRFFKNDPKTGAVSAEPQQFELSRRKLLTEPTSGGLVEFFPTSPVYLSSAGNDYDFATPIQEAAGAILVKLRTRCTQCHHIPMTNLMTYSIHNFPPVPTTRILKASDQERALYVARRKEEREDFKSLVVDDRVTRVENVIRDRMQFYKVPGVSVAVISRGELQWAQGYGVLEAGNSKPVTSETLFQACSISKPVTAVAVLELVQQKKLDLDEDVNVKLKTWKLPENQFTKEKKVTLRGLLSHTAGVTVSGFGGYASNEPVPTLQQILDGLAPANSKPIRVDTTPGSQWRYSGGGFMVVQQLLIDLTGEPFPELMSRMVLRKVGMNDSTFVQRLPEKLKVRTARGHRESGEKVEGDWHIYPEMAAGGMWTTPSDLARLVIELQRSKAGKSEKILSTQTTSEMFSGQMKDFPVAMVSLRMARVAVTAAKSLTQRRKDAKRCRVSKAFFASLRLCVRHILVSP